VIFAFFVVKSFLRQGAGQPPGRLVLGEEVAMLTRKQRRMEAQLHDLTRPSSNA